MELVQQAQEDMSIIDCLSFPLSIISCLIKSGLVPEGHRTKMNVLERFTIICIGCSSKAEERILRETNAFDEVGYFLHAVKQGVDLWLVGPEVSETTSPVERHGIDSSSMDGSSNHHSKLTAHTFKGTANEFFRSNAKLLLSGSCVVIGFNCGFGNFENPGPGRYDLLLSWLPDLTFLTGTQVPVIFTCANDYADLEGEVGIMSRFLGAKFIAAPQRNPFSLASTMVPPGVDPAACTDEYTCGNSFWYAVQGCEKQRRKKIEVSIQDASRRESMERILAAEAFVHIEGCMTAPKVAWLEETLPFVQSPLGAIAAATARVTLAQTIAKGGSSSGVSDKTTKSLIREEADATPPPPSSSSSSSSSKESVSEGNWKQQVSKEGILTLTMELPTTQHMREVRVEVDNGQRLCVTVATPGNFNDWQAHEVTLVTSVDPNSLAAKFHKKKQLLVVTATIVAK